MGSKYLKTFLFSFICLLLICNYQLSFAQQNKIDSLKTQLTKDLSDTTLINLFLAIADKNNYQSPDSAIHYSALALKLAEKIRDSKRIAKATHELGWGYYVKGNYSEALNNYYVSLKISEEDKDKKAISSCFNSIAIVYFNQGNYPKALNHYFKAMEISKELGDKINIANFLGNIGVVYRNQGDYPNALKHYFEALEIDKELGNKVVYKGLGFLIHNSI